MNETKKRTYQVYFHRHGGGCEVARRGLTREEAILECARLNAEEADGSSTVGYYTTDVDDDQ